MDDDMLSAGGDWNWNRISVEMVGENRTIYQNHASFQTFCLSSSRKTDSIILIPI